MQVVFKNTTAFAVHSVEKNKHFLKRFEGLCLYAISCMAPLATPMAWVAEPFSKWGGTSARWKEIVAKFFDLFRNCDVTSIEIWRHYLYTIQSAKMHYFRQNYATMTTYRWTTWNSNRLLQGRPRSSASLGRIIRFILTDWIKPFDACVTEISICFHSGWDYRCQPEWKQIEKKRGRFNNLMKWDRGWRNKLTKQASLHFHSGESRRGRMPE